MKINKETTTTTSYTNSDTLAALNAAHNEHTKASVELIAALDKQPLNHKEIDRLEKKLATVFSRFSDLEKSLPELKFDSHNGEYYFAKDDQGREIRRIRCIFTLSAVVEVAENDPERAIDEAARLIADNKIDLIDDDVSFQFV